MVKIDITARQLADAFEHVAHVDHYMVGIVYEYDSDQLDAAEQVLIDRQHVHNVTSSPEYQTLERALDLLEHLRTVRMRARLPRADTKGSL